MGCVPELKEDDLEAVGVLLGHRKILLRAIAQLSQHAEGMSLGPIPLAVSSDTPPFPAERDQAERRQLTVMFCDLVDSTALSRRVDPEDLQDMIRRFLDACGQSIGRFNGYIAKYLGDGMLVYFGYPQAYENDAERAVHAGLAILEKVKATLWRKLNKSDDAKRMLHSVYSRFTEGVDNRDLFAAKTVLEELRV